MNIPLETEADLGYSDLGRLLHVGIGIGIKFNGVLVQGRAYVGVI